jgi:hypothetical protein
VSLRTVPVAFVQACRFVEDCIGSTGHRADWQPCVFDLIECCPADRNLDHVP